MATVDIGRKFIHHCKNHKKLTKAERSCVLQTGDATMGTIQVALVGTNALLHQGLRSLLNPNQFSIVHEGGEISTFERRLQPGAVPDLVVMDLNSCHDRHFEGLRELRLRHETMHIVVLANELSLTDMARSLRAGADAYLVNDLSGEAFSLSLLLVMEGQKVLPSTLVDVFANGSSKGHDALAESSRNLTEREKEILGCLMNGYSNKHIARALDISEGTVKVHMKSLMKKLSVGNRTQAALWARNNGIDDGIEPHAGA